MRLVVIIQTSVQERVAIHPLPVAPRLLAVDEPPKCPELAIWSKLSVEAMSDTALVEDVPLDVVEVTELQGLLDQAIQPTIGEGAENVISRAEHQAGCALLNIIYNR